MVKFTNVCCVCGRILGILDAYRVPVRGEARVLCPPCHRIGQRYVVLRERGLSDKQAWRKLKQEYGYEKPWLAGILK